jgi:hypothetical protein
MSEPSVRWKREQTFVATDDRGARHYLHVETRTTTTQHSAGSDTTERGETRIVTSTGGVVDRVGRGEYVVRHTGHTLRSDDPQAP